MMAVRCAPTRTVPAFADLDQVIEGMLAPVFRQGAAAVRPEPALNAWHDATTLTIEAEVPGVRPETIDVSISGDEITIKGELPAPPIESGVTVVRRERAAGTFERTARLPFPVDAARVSASYVNGVLTISLPKPTEAGPRRIPVKT